MDDAGKAAGGTGPVAGGEARPPEMDASLYLHPQTLARLGSFELRAKMIVEGFSSGQHRSPYQGLSVEFAQHRPYVAGDDLRHLDWKVYGRTDRLHLKQHQQETSLDLVVLVDSSGSMSYGSRGFAEASGEGRKTSLDGRAHWSKFDHATALAAALAYITLRQGDRAGVVVFADEVRAMVRRSSSQGTWRQIIGALSMHAVEPANRNRPTDLARVVEQVAGTINNRCLMAVISDLFIDPEAFRDALARLRFRGHDVIVFQVLDKAEEDFAFTDAAPFEGLEGEAMLRVDPRALRSAYLEVAQNHMAQIERITRAFSFDYQRISTHDWLGPPLAAFVARRNAMIKGRKQT
ncbi:MAG TPA: DUF58 domain-containing protein [Phycisphaerales bacterium]|nr:DUF58 domain-containing protein [Phycisphaerales bacterium]